MKVSQVSESEQTGLCAILSEIRHAFSCRDFFIEINNGEDLLVSVPSEHVATGKHSGGVLKIRLMIITNLLFFISALFVTVYDVSSVDSTISCFD